MLKLTTSFRYIVRNAAEVHLNPFISSLVMNGFSF